MAFSNPFDYDEFVDVYGPAEWFGAQSNNPEEDIKIEEITDKENPFVSFEEIEKDHAKDIKPPQPKEYIDPLYAPAEYF